MGQLRKVLKLLHYPDSGSTTRLKRVGATQAFATKRLDTQLPWARGLAT